MHRDQPGAVAAGRQVLLADITALALVALVPPGPLRLRTVSKLTSSADIHDANRYIATLRANS